MKTYLKAIPGLAAERQLLAVEAAVSPNMTEQARHALLNRYQRRIGGDQRHKSAAGALLAAGIAVEHVRKG